MSGIESKIKANPEAFDDYDNREKSFVPNDEYMKTVMNPDWNGGGEPSEENADGENPAGEK